MPQRFYPYAHIPDDGSQPILCIAVGCLNLASWWDTEYGTYWCDFHATAEVVTSERVFCRLCDFSYPPALVQDGVCLPCQIGTLIQFSKEVS